MKKVKCSNWNDGSKYYHNPSIYDVAWTYEDMIVLYVSTLIAWNKLLFIDKYF